MGHTSAGLSDQLERIWQDFSPDSSPFCFGAVEQRSGLQVSSEAELVQMCNH